MLESNFDSSFVFLLETSVFTSSSIFSDLDRWQVQENGEDIIGSGALLTFCLSPSLAAPLVDGGRRDESDEHFKDKKVFIWPQRPLNFVATPVDNGRRDDEESLRRKMSTSRTRRCLFILSSAVVAPPVDGHLARALKAHVG